VLKQSSFDRIIEHVVDDAVSLCLVSHDVVIVLVLPEVPSPPE